MTDGKKFGKLAQIKLRVRLDNCFRVWKGNAPKYDSNFFREEIMLAAALRGSDSLSLIKLILSLVGTDAQTIPEQLKDHFLVVVGQAKRLAADPNAVDPQVLPEAIDLAFEIRSDEALKTEMEEISDFQSVSPDLARRVLDHIGDGGNALHHI